MAAAAPPAPSPPPPPPAGPCCPGSWPNFAVVCSFLERYGALLDLPELPFPDLERVLQPPQEPGDQGERPWGSLPSALPSPSPFLPSSPQVWPCQNVQTNLKDVLWDLVGNVNCA
uniref:Uncharacterized protein n=1 Tax=Pavo cristatus TaxID=9049 RepID=A0A8C9FDK9_PAVCR